MSFLIKVNQEAAPKLKEEFGLKNNLALPRLEKIVINAGTAQEKESKESAEKVRDQLSAMSGQKPQVRPAKNAISAFKLRKNEPIGMRVTLRGKRAWEFLEKLIGVVLPRMRDFRGVSAENFDKMGNYSLGIQEQTLFPEVDYSKVDRVRGLVVTLVIKNSSPEKSKRFLELLGVPFRNA